MKESKGTVREKAQDNAVARPEVVLAVYGYTEYRVYLRDFYEWRKASERGYSFRLFARKAGFSSPNMLQLVMEGKRNLTNDSMEKFIKGLQLSGHMADYFRHMVKMNQSASDDEKIVHFKAMERLTPHAKRRELGGDAMEYLSHWLYPVLRDMILLPEFKNDPYWIAQRLTGKASAEEIARALSFLEKANFIVKDLKGTYVPKDDIVISSDEVRSLVIRQYHRMMIEQAKERLADLEPVDREFGALTFVLPDECFAELKNKMKEFRRNLHLWALEMAKDHVCDAVIQVNMLMYPQTKRRKKA